MRRPSGTPVPSSCLRYPPGAFHVLVFFFPVLFSIVVTSLGTERAVLYSSHEFVCLSCMRLFLSFFSSSWCQGLAAACDCGTTGTFFNVFIKNYIGTQSEDLSTAKVHVS